MIELEFLLWCVVIAGSTFLTVLVCQLDRDREQAIELLLLLLEIRGVK